MTHLISINTLRNQIMVSKYNCQSKGTGPLRNGWFYCLQCRIPGFNLCVGKIWRRAWLLSPVFLPGEFQGRRALAGYSLWGLHGVGYNWATNTFTFSLLNTLQKKTCFVLAGLWTWIWQLFLFKWQLWYKPQDNHPAKEPKNSSCDIPPSSI